jgi:hypothetical protein
VIVDSISELQKYVKNGSIGLIFPPNNKDIPQTFDLIIHQLKTINPDIAVSNVVFKFFSLCILLSLQNRVGTTHFENWNSNQVCLFYLYFA